MELLLPYLFILVIHYLGDWIFQSHWMASNKSTNNLALFLHLASYTGTLLIGLLLGNYLYLGLPISTVVEYVVVNGMIHGLIDICTSRMSTYFWNKKSWHNFFAVIGGDQLLHQLTLGLTLFKLFY
jgi:hypothetical protein